MATQSKNTKRNKAQTFFYETLFSKYLKIKNQKTKKLKTKACFFFLTETFYSFNLLLLFISISKMSSLTQIDGAAIARHTRNAPIEMIDKDDSSLPKCFSRQPPSTRTMTNSELHSRLGEILTSCIRALPVKKTVDEYVSNQIHSFTIFSQFQQFVPGNKNKNRIVIVSRRRVYEGIKIFAEYPVDKKKKT